MSRSTPEDEAFKRKVAAVFKRARDQARERGISMDVFVERLGVTRAAFYKYVNCKAIPSLRVLQKARKYFGVEISYGELPQKYIAATKKDPRQMQLQFSIEDVSKEQIEIKRFTPKGDNAAELVIKIHFSKSA